MIQQQNNYFLLKHLAGHQHQANYKSALGILQKPDVLGDVSDLM